MSGNDVVVGEVLATLDGESMVVRWKIPGGRSFGFFCSPEFAAFDSSWQLNFVYTGDTILQLERRDSGLPRIIDYTWKIQQAHSTVKNGPHDRNMFVDKGDHTFDIIDLRNERTDLVPCNTLTVVFWMSLANDKEITQKRCEAGQATQLKEGATSKSDAEKRDVKHLRTLSQNLKHLYREGLDCDVRIRVRNRIFGAHKAILRARIPAFADMFSRDITERNDIIIMDDCHPDVFDEFLLFVYSGEVERLSDENVLGLYNAAEKYNLQELKKECMEYMTRKYIVENFFDILRL